MVVPKFHFFIDYRYRQKYSLHSRDTVVAISITVHGRFHYESAKMQECVLQVIWQKV